MAYFKRFREPGAYEAAMQQIDARRRALISQTQQHQPEDIEVLLATCEDGEVIHELDWVEIPHPENDTTTITVRPFLRIASGREDAEDVNDLFDKGPFALLLEGQLPSGKPRVMGEMTFFHDQGTLRWEPLL